LTTLAIVARLLSTCIHHCLVWHSTDLRSSHTITKRQS
jgi:hypothetical protein